MKKMKMFVVLILVGISAITLSMVVNSKSVLTQEQLAIIAWKELLELPAKLEERDPIMKEIKIKAHFRLVVETLAAQIKSGKLNPKEISISYQDFLNALDFLNESLPLYIDQESRYGNKDGRCSPQEMNEFIKKKRSNTGFKLFQGYYRSYLEEKYN